MIDNYDSFTYNLVQYFGELGEDVRVYRNDAITLEQIEAWRAGQDRHFARALHAVRGGHLRAAHRSASPARFRSSAYASATRRSARRSAAASCAPGGSCTASSREVTHRGRGVFAGLQSPLTVTRYHSLAIERASLPACLEVTGESDDGEIMGVRHKDLAVEGVQFHPEAILTHHGHELLANFLNTR